MKRRALLATVGIGLAAGCLSSDNVDGDVVVDETIYGQSQVWNFEADEGDTINVWVENDAGFVAWVSIEGPDEELLVDNEEVETEFETSVTAENTGVHRAVLGGDEEASIQVAVED